LQVLCTASTATSSVSKGGYFEANRLRNYICCLWFTGGQAEEIITCGRDERERLYTLKIVSDYSKTGLGAEFGTMRSLKKVGQKIKSDDVRYRNFGNKNTENDVSESTKINSISIFY